MTLVDELLHLTASDVEAGQHGEYGLLAGEHLLVQYGVGVVAGHQTRRAEDDHDGVHIVVTLLAEVDADAQVLGSTCCQEVDGVGYRRAGIELFLQFLANLLVEHGHVHAALAQGVGQHHTGTAGMGDDGNVLAGHLGQGEHAADGG